MKSLISNTATKRFPARPRNGQTTGIQNLSARVSYNQHPGDGGKGDTRRKQKHDLLITFLANTNTRRPAPVKSPIMKALFSFLF